MSIAVRPARPTDEDAIWAILQPVFGAGDTYCVPPDLSRASALAYWSGGNHRTYIAETDIAETDTAVGGTYFLCANQRGGGAHVANAGFATAQSARGKGIARAMLDHALEEARSAGFRAMQFNFVVSTNTRAIAIWESAGFATVGRLPGAFAHPEHGYVDALVMFRDL
jgi:ribosomal protein S18 acetylase RimI-like enzyme